MYYLSYFQLFQIFSIILMKCFQKVPVQVCGRRPVETGLPGSHHPGQLRQHQQRDGAHQDDHRN